MPWVLDLRGQTTVTHTAWTFTGRLLRVVLRLQGVSSDEHDSIELGIVLENEVPLL